MGAANAKEAIDWTEGAVSSGNAWRQQPAEASRGAFRSTQQHVGAPEAQHVAFPGA